MTGLRGPLLVVLLLALAACAPVTTRAQFLAAFSPSPQTIDRYDRVRHAPYTPRIALRGVAAVQRAVNAVPYRADGAGGDWEAPARFWTHGGDCEEYALTKGAELAAQGFTHRYLTIVRERGSNRAHALLTVEDDGTIVVLDNLVREVVPWHRAVQRYRPVYAIDLSTHAVLVARDSAKP